MKKALHTAILSFILIILNACALTSSKNSYEFLFKGNLEPVNTEAFKQNFTTEFNTTTKDNK